MSTPRERQWEDLCDFLKDVQLKLQRIQLKTLNPPPEVDIRQIQEAHKKGLQSEVYKRNPNSYGTGFQEGIISGLQMALEALGEDPT